VANDLVGVFAAAHPFHRSLPPQEVVICRHAAALVPQAQWLRMEDSMTQAARFRELMRRDGMVVAPGAYDCITARLIERAGFDAVYMTGAGTAATLGYPDFGLVTMSEMVENAGRITAAVA